MLASIFEYIYYCLLAGTARDGSFLFVVQAVVFCDLICNVALAGWLLVFCSRSNLYEVGRLKLMLYVFAV